MGSTLRGWAREPGDADQYDDSAGDLGGGDGFAEQPVAEEQQRDRAEHAQVRGAWGADARNREHSQKHRRHGAQQAIDQRQLKNRKRLFQVAEAVHQQVVNEAQGCRYQHDVGDQAQAAEARDQLSRHDEIARVRERCREHQRAAE